MLNYSPKNYANLIENNQVFSDTYENLIQISFNYYCILTSNLIFKKSYDVV